MSKFKFIATLIGAFCTVPLLAAEIAGVPRDSNYNNTGGYDSTRVEAQLLVAVKENTKVVHFIRDNNDPRVVTKTYLLKHVDAYEFRDYLRQMVQAKRVGNTSLQQQYPGNTANPANITTGVTTANPNVATTGAAILTTPVNSQPSYTPTTQLGSNTAVECLKYVDGTGILIVSAEDYRFEDHENGMGIDSLVEFFDKPQMGADYGTQTFFYLPKYVPAMNLVSLIENVGMNVSDVTELWQGEDLVAYDPDLNWLIFDVDNYSCYNIARMLAKYDVPIPQVRLRLTVYEIYTEDDDKIGFDFLGWKNNEGAGLFSGGGRYRRNFPAAYGLGSMSRSYGTERTSYYNFNPAWNSRYLDFLSSTGHARITHTGELLIRNNTPAAFSRTTQLFYSDTGSPVPAATAANTYGVGPYELLSNIIGVATATVLPVGKGAAQTVETSSAGFGFTMTVNNASVNLAECRFNITLNNTSLIGFESNGSPRVSSGSTINVDVSLPYGKDSFVIGGLKKESLVKSQTGVPWLCKIPILGWLFATESTSIKHSELIVVGQCEYDSPPDTAVDNNTNVNTAPPIAPTAPTALATPAVTPTAQL